MPSSTVTPSFPRRHQLSLAGAGGFAILEVLVASVIVSFTAVGIAVMFSTGQAYIQGQGDNRVALFLAQQRLEEYRAVVFTDARLAPTDTTTTEPPAGTLENPVPNHPGYRRLTKVFCVSETSYSTRIVCPASPRAKMIEVTVESLSSGTVERRTGTQRTGDPAGAITLRTVRVDR